MKTLAPLTQDGFKASIELLRFQREQNNDLIHAITSIVGTAPTFIKGGDITQTGGNTTITNGIISYNEKLYTFTGGTYAGTPATLKVLFEENTAAGYPQPYFVGDPIPKNIYLSRTARIDTTGTLFLSAVGKISNIQLIKSDIESVKSEYIHITEAYPPITVNSPFSGVILINKYSNSTYSFYINMTHSSNVAKNTIIATLPISLGFSYRCVRGFFINKNGNSYNHTNNIFVDLYFIENGISTTQVILGTAITATHNYINLLFNI